MKLLKLAAAVALIAAASAASATVTFDPSTGTGFVGKGDVQIPYGWNNAQLQRNASGLTFVYVSPPKPTQRYVPGPRVREQEAKRRI